VRKKISLSTLIHPAQIRNIIAVALFLIPFFWLAPGQVTYGGDDSRLYYFKPIEFLKHFALYPIRPEGTRLVEPSHYYIPYASFIWAVQQFFRSDTLVVDFFNGIKLSFGFLYLSLLLDSIGKKFFPISTNNIHSLASVIAGLFYLLGTSKFGWDKSLVSHNQIFLNPMVLYYIYRFFDTEKLLYGLLAVAITFVFAPNFAFTSAPQFFSFYPISVLFIAAVFLLSGKKTFPLKKTLVLIGVALLVHSFHVLPQLANLLQKGSYGNARVFDAEFAYSLAIRSFRDNLSHISPSASLLVPAGFRGENFPAIVALLCILFAGVRTTNILFYLSAVFFFLTYYLSTAHVTPFGIRVYEQLFAIPGFLMFRTFYEKWLYVYVFFYSVTLYTSLLVISQSVRKYLFAGICIILCVLIGYKSMPLYSGTLVNTTHEHSEGIKKAFYLDPDYGETLSYISTLPYDGKAIQFPFSGNYMQVLFDSNKSAYLGPSMIPVVTGHSDFAGLWNFEGNADLARKTFDSGDLQSLIQLFSIMNIRYIHINNDPRVMEQFPDYPIYRNASTHMPKSIGEYNELVQKLPVTKVFEKGLFSVYKLQDETAWGQVYSPTRIASNSAQFQSEYDPLLAFITTEQCDDGKTSVFCTGNFDMTKTSVSTRRISPVEYAVTAVPDDPNKPFIISFQDSYNESWELSILDGASVESHFMINGYANAWLVRPEVGGSEKHTMTIRLKSQIYTKAGFIVSVLGLSLLLLGFAGSLFTKKKI
jgi:hypothetical protein